MGAGKCLDTVLTTLLATQRGLRISLDDAGNVVLIHLFSERSVQRLPCHRWSNRWQEAAGHRVAASAEVRYLTHRVRTMGMNA